jgi:hypothetical protein
MFKKVILKSFNQIPLTWSKIKSTQAHALLQPQQQQDHHHQQHQLHPQDGHQQQQHEQLSQVAYDPNALHYRAMKFA